MQNSGHLGFLGGWDGTEQGLDFLVKFFWDRMQESSHHDVRPQHAEFIHTLLLALEGLWGGLNQSSLVALEPQQVTGRMRRLDSFLLWCLGP